MGVDNDDLRPTFHGNFIEATSDFIVWRCYFPALELQGAMFNIGVFLNTQYYIMGVELTMMI